jgi:hypothetical protein
MKHTNFITTLSLQQQYEIRHWFIASLIIIVTTLFLMIIYFAPQIYSLYLTKKEISSFKEKTRNYTTTTNNRSALKKENTLLQMQRSKINNYLLNPKNPHTYITNLTTLCNNNIIIEQIRTNKKNFELIILCPTTEGATLLVQQITDTGYFTDAKITSLQQHNQKNQFQCTIKGMIKK